MTISIEHMMMNWMILWTSMAMVHMAARLGSGVDDERWLQQLYHATNGDGFYSACNSGWLEDDNR